MSALKVVDVVDCEVKYRDTYLGELDAQRFAGSPSIGVGLDNPYAAQVVHFNRAELRSYSIPYHHCHIRQIPPRRPVLPYASQFRRRIITADQGPRVG